MGSINRALETTVIPLNADQIFTLEGYVDKNIPGTIAKKSGVSLEDPYKYIDNEPIETKKQKK